YRWLKDFVDTPLAPREIADRLVNAGIEVSSIAKVADGLSGGLVGELLAIERDLGTTPSGHRNVLCRGAVPRKTFAGVWRPPNAVPGIRPALAPPGATLPGGHAVRAATIRGVASEGMLCSERELGISDDHAGVLALPPDAPLGGDLVAYLGLDDAVLEIEI